MKAALHRCLEGRSPAATGSSVHTLPEAPLSRLWVECLLLLLPQPPHHPHSTGSGACTTGLGSNVFQVQCSSLRARARSPWLSSPQSLAWGRGFTLWQLPSCNKTKTDTGREQAPVHQHREAGGLEGGAGKRRTEEKPEACTDAGTKQSEMSWEKLKNQGSESSSACRPQRGWHRSRSESTLCWGPCHPQS